MKRAGIYKAQNVTFNPKTMDPDQLFECIRDNLQDMGLVFDDAMDDELYEEIESQLRGAK